MIPKDLQYYKFCSYGFLKNLRFFDPFILLFFRSIGMSYLQIGVLFSVREISTTVLELPTGIIADLFGRKNSMISSFLAYILSFIIFYTSSKYSLFIIAMFLFAAGEAFRTGTHKAMIFDYLKIKNISHLKTEYYGHTRSWSQKGSALSSLIAGALVFFTGKYRIIFLATIVPYIIELFLMMSYPKELNGLQFSLKKSKNRPNWKDFIHIFKRVEFRRGILNSSLYDGLFKTIKDYLQPILKSFAISLPILIAMKDDQRSAVIIAAVFFLLYNLTSYASKNASAFSHRFRNLPKAINITFLFGIFVTIMSGLFYNWHLSIISIALFILLYMMQNVRRPMNVSYISETIPGKLMATGLSVESQLKTLAIAVFSPIVGVLADQLGVGIAIALMACVLILLYPLVRVAEAKLPEKIIRN
ncbi:MAG: MFS transporter, partial [Candidatus Marinimicrobia bacterium]|nr:MFS transporter [Candidatus Neomarinimicrobiota bacterium]